MGRVAKVLVVGMLGVGVALTGGSTADAATSINVRDELHQLGGWIHTDGWGFTPNRAVTFYSEGLVRLPGRQWRGSTTAGPDGRFTNAIVDVRCWSGQPRGSSVDWIVRDDATGTESRSWTSSFSCG